MLLPGEKGEQYQRDGNKKEKGFSQGPSGAIGLMEPPDPVVIRGEAAGFEVVKAMGVGDLVDLFEGANSTSGISGSQKGVEGLIGGLQWAVLMLERPIEKEDSTRRKESRSVSKEAVDGLKGGNVNHIDGDNHVGLIEREVLVEEIHRQGGEEIGQSGLQAPGLDAVESTGAVRGLPGDVGKSPGEGGAVLTGTATEFDHSGECRRREKFFKDGGDGLFVSFAGCGEGFHDRCTPRGDCAGAG